MNQIKKTLHQQGCRFTFLIFFGTIFPQFEVLAQSVAPSNIETLVVSGSRFEENIDRIPANLQVISKEQIQQSSSTNLADVLQQLGNVPMGNQSGSLLGIGATPDLGGYGATATSNTLILLNGIRLNPIDSSSASLNSIPISSIERIEILNGGASVQFGNNAPGGVINIITKEGGDQPSQVSLSYGSYGTLITDASIIKKEGDRSLVISANSSKTNGWRDNSDALSTSFNGRLTQGLGGTDKVFLEANAYHMQTNYPYFISGFEVGQGSPYMANPIKKGNGIVQDGSLARTGISKELGNNFLFEMEAAYGSSSALSNDNESFGLTIFQYEKSQLDLTPRIKANWGRWGSSILGFDRNISDGSRNIQSSTPSQNHVNLKNDSIYFMERLPINDQFEMMGGFRRQKQDISWTTANSYDSSYTPISNGNYLTSFFANAYDIGINYRYLPGQRLYTKYDQSYRFANTDEYFGYNPITGNNFTNGAILRPQINKTIEIGGDFTYEDTKVNASIFQTNSHDEIRLFNDPNTYSQTNINDDDIRRTGVNFNVISKISNRLRIGTGFRYQRAVYTSGANIGNLVSLVPQYLFNLNARYQATSQIALGGVLNYVSAQYYDGDLQNTYNQMPSYVFGDVYAEYRLKVWEARFTIKNVSNANYAVYGNNIAALGGNAYQYLPAPPRFFWATLKYNF